MNVKTMLTGLCLVASASALTAQSANSCTMGPIDTQVQAADMLPLALAALKVESKNVTNVNSEELKGEYIWTNPMCPEGIKASAKFSISFENPADPLAKGCLGIAHVSKTQSTGLSNIPVKHEYKVEVIQPGTCLQQ